MIIKIPKQLWRVSNGKGMLVYMTSYEDDASCRKRQNTGLTWANPQDWRVPKKNDPFENKGVTFDNVPTVGFKCIDFAVRSTTDNKVIEIYDPRGFHIQTPIKNFFEMMSESTIINGEIQGECVWAREGSNLALIPVDSKLFRNSKQVELNNIKTTAELRPGDVFTYSNRSSEYICLGSAILEYSVDTVDYYNRPRGNSKPVILSTDKFNGVDREILIKPLNGSGVEAIPTTYKAVLLRKEPPPVLLHIEFVNNHSRDNDFSKGWYMFVTPNKMASKEFNSKYPKKRADNRMFHWTISNINWLN